MDFLELCKNVFETDDLYQILKITKHASSAEIREAYHSLSRQIHPDRVSIPEKALATEKFKLLQKIFGILSNDFTKTSYDKKGIVVEFEKGTRVFTISDAQMNDCIMKYAGMMMYYYFINFVCSLRRCWFRFLSFLIENDFSKIHFILPFRY